MTTHKLALAIYCAGSAFILWAMVYGFYWFLTVCANGGCP